MDQQNAGYSAIVTMAVLGVLLVVGFLYKMGKNQELLAYRPEVAGAGAISMDAASSSVSGVSPGATNESGVNWNYEVLLDCQLVESRVNGGSTFRVRHRGQEYVFQLYFAEAPETSMTNPDRVRGQCRHFNYITEEQLLSAGLEAGEFTRDLLRRKPFTVFTRWEKVLQTSRFFGFVHVEAAPGEKRFLSELLAERGYGSVDEQGRKLPNGASEEDYRTHLRELEKAARKSGVGIWRRKET